MIRKFFLLFALTILVTCCYAQLNTDSSIIKEFTLKGSEKANPDFYIIEIHEKAPAEFKNQILLNSIRKLSETIYIIEKNNLQAISRTKFFLKEISLTNNYWKLSPAAYMIKVLKNYNTRYHFLISLKNIDSFINKLFHDHPSLKYNINILSSLKLVTIYCTYEEIESLFLDNKDVLFIDASISSPKEELAFAGFDLSANKLNLVHSRYPSINGSTQHVSIKENYYDTADIDLKGRLEISPLASAIVTNHANFMATIIAGGGNSVYYAKGAAWAAGISSSSFDQVLPDPSAYYNQYNITVQNHSYGTSVDNTYGLNAVAFDKSANDNQNLLHVFSSGNSGNTSSSAGIYSGITGFANLTGNFKMSKNTISVGAVDSFGNVASLSSKGPAYDGRIKPEITAFEKNGTSEAAALVSGTALLLQQYYKSKTSADLPSAMAKAILINSADDINSTGPDFATGFGNLNASKAMDIIKNNSLFSGVATQNATQTFLINVPANISALKITLAWNDIAATTFSPTALVNDLDLTVVSPSNEIWKPWVLSSYPHIDSLNKLPQRKRDSLNNVEQVTIQNPAAGNYQIKINGFNIPAASQVFYVAYLMDTANSFQWQYPANIDFLETGRENILRWQSTIVGSGNIEFNFPPSNSWISIPSNVDLTKKYIKWTPPDTTAQCLLRMKIGGSYFISDTFLISSLVSPKVGFICSDSLLFYWNKIKGINNYKIYQLGDKYMGSLIDVSDTVALLGESTLTSKYFSVAPVLPGGKVGPKSYAFDYTIQGTGCFVKTFYADAIGNTATLTLLIGTTYKIRSISYQILTASGFSDIYNFQTFTQTSFSYNYQPLKPGMSQFRTKIILQDGEIIYSNMASVFYVEPGKYIVFPIPAKKGSDIEVLTTIPNEEIIQFYDVMGRVVLQKEIQSAHEYIPTSSLQAGQYFYRITKNGMKLSSGKLLIL